MVRVNILQPKYLVDQHLIAEYLEILMLIGYVKLYPSTIGIPDRYCLGTGHIKFFKNKLNYLCQRHEKIKKEMKKRGFTANKSIDVTGIPKSLWNNWTPRQDDVQIIKDRLLTKITLKPEFYRYYRKRHSLAFYTKLIKSAHL